MNEEDNDLPDLSKAEFNILRHLWKSGPQAVRDVHAVMERRHGWALTTTRTVMDRMAKKGLLRRELSDGVFLYAPLVARAAGLAKMVRFFAENVLEIHPTAVVSMFSDTSAISDAEVEELRRLLEQE